MKSLFAFAKSPWPLFISMGLAILTVTMTSLGGIVTQSPSASDSDSASKTPIEAVEEPQP